MITKGFFFKPTDKTRKYAGIVINLFRYNAKSVMIDLTNFDYTPKNTEFLMRMAESSNTLFVDHSSKNIPSDLFRYLTKISKIITGDLALSASYIEYVGIVITGDPFIAAAAMANGKKTLLFPWCDTSQLSIEGIHLNELKEISVAGYYKSLKEYSEDIVVKNSTTIEVYRNAYKSLINNSVKNYRVMSEILMENLRNRAGRKRLVCFVYHHMAVGGAEKVTYNIMKYIDRNKIYPVVFVVKNKEGKGANELERNIKDLDIPVIYLNDIFSGMYNNELSEFLSKFDVIHFNYWGQPDLLNILKSAKARNSNLKMLLVSHSSLIDVNTAMPYFDLSVSVYPHKILLEKGGMKYIPTGITITPTKEYSKEDLGINSNDPVIVSVGHVDSNKNYNELVPLAKALKDSGISAKIIIVGATDFSWSIDAYHRLLSSIKDSGVEEMFIFTGTVNDPERYIQISDVCIHPSKHECFSGSILEYMINKKPVVIPRRITNDFFNDTRCLVYEDVKGLIRIVKDLLSSKIDTSGLVHRNYQDILRFNFKKVARIYSKIYQDFDSVAKIYRWTSVNDFLDGKIDSITRIPVTKPVSGDAVRSAVTASKEVRKPIPQMIKEKPLRTDSTRPILEADTIAKRDIKVHYNRIHLEITSRINKELSGTGYSFGGRTGHGIFIDYNIKEPTRRSSGIAIPPPILTLFDKEPIIGHKVGIICDNATEQDFTNICAAVAQAKGDFPKNMHVGVYINNDSPILRELISKYRVNEYIRLGYAVDEILSSCNVIICHKLADHINLFSLFSGMMFGRSFAVFAGELNKGASYLSPANVIRYSSRIELSGCLLNNVPSNVMSAAKGTYAKYNINSIISRVRKMI